jgi:hypothetical protein
VLEALAEKLRDSPEVWTTTAGAVADWWRAKSHVHIEHSSDGKTVGLLNTGDKPFEGGRLIIDAPNGTRKTVALPVIQPGATLTVDASGRVTNSAATRASLANAPAVHSPIGSG